MNGELIIPMKNVNKKYEIVLEKKNRVPTTNGFATFVDGMPSKSVVPIHFPFKRGES